MCGISGIYNLKKDRQIDTATLKRMTLLLRHRGPDEFGFYQNDKIGSLIKKCRKLESHLISAKDNMSVVSVITTLLLDKIFIRDFDSSNKKICTFSFLLPDICVIFISAGEVYKLFFR